MEVIEMKEGSKAPDFKLPGTDDLFHSLKDYEGKKIIFYFYPKDNTAGWTSEAISFRDNMKDLNEINAIVIGISRDSIESHKKFILKYNLPFLLLSDVDETACNLYDVIKGKNMYGKKTFGVERSTFIIDEKGTLIKIYRKVKVEGHVRDIIDFLKSNE